MLLSISDCLAKASQLVESDSARIDVERLLCFVLNKKRAYLFAWPEKELNEVQNQQFLTLLSRRLSGEPVAHIVGTHEFWSVELEVNASTLIPRPETELLVELALNHAKSEMRLLDMGTGTGAVALALASELPDSQVLGVDKIDAAIALADRNKARNGLKNVTFSNSDWFSDVDGCFDIIVSNPPYIELDDPHLNRGDLRFEPHTALVAGVSGLDDINIIIKQSKDYLFEQGWLMLEHGYKQAEAVRRLFISAGFDCVETVRDLSNNDRVTLGCWNG